MDIGGTVPSRVRENPSDIHRTLKQLSLELHRRAVKPPVTRSVQALPGEIWGVDLAEPLGTQFTKENDGYRYVLIVEDIGSRHVWAVPQTNKNAKTTLESLNTILRLSGHDPERIWADEGSEFVNTQVATLLRRKGIEMYHTHGTHKVAHVERFIRTLKTMLQKEMTARNTRRWIDFLPAVIQAYNNRKHSGIGAVPSVVWANREIVGAPRAPPRIEDKPKFAVGDWVRVSRLKGIFEKEHDANWTQELFRVTAVNHHPGEPYTYKIADYNGEDIVGSFYAQELQKTMIDPKNAFVEKVIKTRKHGTESFVKWLGWPAKMNSWVATSSLRDLQ